MSKPRKGKRKAGRTAALALPTLGTPGRASDDPAEWGPAPADRPRLAPVPIENMFARGQLGIEQYNAAREIERVFLAITAGLLARTSDPNRPGGARRGITPPMLEAYTERYLPWSKRLSASHAEAPDVNEIARVVRCADEGALVTLALRAGRTQQPRATAFHPQTLQWIIELLIDGRSIETIARTEHRHHRTVKAALLAGLTLYAEMAGWLRRAA
jgi:hypothetical protein